MNQEYVILVDKEDNQIGVMEKIEAHKKALLHRAFSVFILNSQGELMLQQRAFDKYHCGGLWTNTCCSHQRVSESTLDAAKRRLHEEMGFVTDLEEKFTFVYKAPFENGLTEHELDHVLIGKYDGIPKLNLKEAASWKWMKLAEIKQQIKKTPEEFTPWFKIIFEKFYNEINLKLL